MDEQTKVIKRLKIALVCVVILFGGLACTFGFLWASRAGMVEQLQSQVYAGADLRTDLHEQIDYLESQLGETENLNVAIAEQEKTINEQAERIFELETKLAACSKSTSSSDSSDSGHSNSSTSSNSDTQTVTVYITRTGEKYHRDGCRYLSQSKIPVSLSDAKAQGYTTCSVCF